MTATTDPIRRPRPATWIRRFAAVGAVVALLVACTDAESSETDTADPGRLDTELDDVEIEPPPPLPDIDEDGSVDAGTVLVHGLTPGERGLHALTAGDPDASRSTVPLGDYDGANAPVVAPDGSTLAAVAWPRGSGEIAHVLVVGNLEDGFEELVVDDELDMWCVQWFPDGERLLLTAFVEESYSPRLLEVDLDGEITEHSVDPGRYDCAIPLGGDEVLLTYIGIGTDIQGVARADLSTGAAELFYMKLGCMIYGGGISPDGAALLTAAACDDPSDSGLHLVDLDTGEDEQVLAGPVAFPAWSPTGDWIVFGLYPDLDSSESTIWAIRLDGSGFRPIDEEPGAQPAWLGSVIDP